MVPAVLLLGSCQPPPYEIIAQLEKGKMVFHARDRGFFGQPFGWNDDGKGFTSMTVFSGSHGYWQIELRKNISGECAFSGNFPVTYGEERCDYDIKLPAETLPKGQKYRIVYQEFFALKDTPEPSRKIDDTMYGEGEGSFAIGVNGRIDVLAP